MSTTEPSNMKESLLVTPELFTELVSLKHKDQLPCSKSYIDAVVSTCDELDIDPEDCKSYLSKALIAVLEAEAQDNNLLKDKTKVAKLF